MGLAHAVEGQGLVWAYGGDEGEGAEGEGSEGEGGDGEGGGGDGDDREGGGVHEGVDHTVDRSQVAAKDVQGNRPYVRRSVRQRVMPSPGVEERLVQVESRLAQVESDVAVVRGDVQWMVEAIVAIHSGAPLPPRAGAAPTPPPPP
ncbi:homeobox protein Hox-D11-like [Helianthus annuus]|uniref:homeobox protein Hox-D11-like n=1 Tax=Helianthus annuus TaxID=4232 RepID=UPI000B8FD1ED|nr:homeobox protein Hox-D11-like [Helianthus annuus]